MLPETIAGAATALRRGEVTSESLVTTALHRARALDPELGVFVTICTDAALDAARRADADLRDGTDRGSLHGIPVAVKDILATADAPTTAQSRAFDGSAYAGRDAAAVGALRRAGAVIVGKTSLSEFAIGLPEPGGPFPLPRNPWVLSRWAGGSSAGTASGLAAGLFLGGLGTDTGGSIRIPAAFCGVTGLKPTRGLVNRDGCAPLSASLDEVGPMATTARDCALLLDALAVDTTSPTRFSSQLGGSATGLHVGLERRHYREASGVDEVAVAAFESALAALEQAGATVSEVTIPDFDLLAAATSIVLLCEALEVHTANLRARWHDYGRTTRLRLAMGAFYSGADYVRAVRCLRDRREQVAAAIASFDVVATLTTGAGAWPIEGMVLNAPSLAPFFTRVWSGLGFPAISVPIGFDDDGLPLGMQLVGPPAGDAAVLRAADAYQAISDWHLKRPALAADTGAYA